MLQRFRSTEHLDRESPQSPRQLGYGGRRLKPTARRVLVGTPAMVVSMGTIQHEEVVPGYDANTVYHLGQTADPAGYRVGLFRLFPLRLGRILLARRHPSGLLPPYA